MQLSCIRIPLGQVAYVPDSTFFCERAAAGDARLGMDAVKECCSLEGHIKGIKFYDGFCSIRSMMNVRITREASNLHDSNTVLVSYRGRVIGHLDFMTAAAVAPLMDMNIPSLLIKV